MGNTFAIFRKELRVTFVTPVAYVALCVFILITGFFFTNILGGFNHRIATYAQMRPRMLQYMNFTDQVLQPVFYNVAVVFVFVVPFITMRLVAEERRSNTFELLRSCPVTPLQITLGKYLASLVVVLAMVALVLVYPLLVWAYAEVGGPDWPTVWTGLLGIFLAGAAFTAVGLLVSSLTSSQIVAAAITFCVLLLLWVAGWAADDHAGVTREVLLGLSAVEHIRSFTRGLLDVKDLVYYLSMAVLGLLMTRRVLESHRWR